MRSISRVADVSFNTVAKLLADAGEACEAFHDEAVRGRPFQAGSVRRNLVLTSYCKQRNVATAKAAPDQAGDLWTWTALDCRSQADRRLPDRRPGRGLRPTSSCRT